MGVRGSGAAVSAAAFVVAGEIITLVAVVSAAQNHTVTKVI